MTIDCRKYQDTLLKSRNSLAVIYERNGDLSKTATEFSISSGIPLLVVCVYLESMFDQDLNQKIKGLQHFYKYSEIIGFDGKKITP